MKVLVVMPTYGRIPFLNRALASFLSQDYENKELVIINDDSNVQLKCNYSNVICINLNKKILIGDKKNLATNIGKYDIYVPYDDDDIMLPNRLTNCIKMHTNNPNIGLYANKKSYTIYGPEFTIADSGANTISYTQKAWFQVMGYCHTQNSGEDQEFRSKIKNQLICDDINLIDYVYNWGGINYHLTYSLDNNIVQIAYNQLKNLNLINSSYTIEPDYIEYNKFVELDKRYKINQQPIEIIHKKLAHIDII